ncbi:MAG TPA: SAM-dependent methyltransferase, partial [Balneolales bacterium]|nr:SAM-dependent methyltransferase [Balneolales bacterium]
PQRWKCLANCETLVILMGVRRLSQIAENLILHGKSKSTPVAVIEKASQQLQKKVIGTLGNIAVKAKHIETPATIVIGEVVSLSYVLDWFEPKTEIFSDRLTEVISMD